MEEVAMAPAKTQDENFIQSMSAEMTIQANIVHFFEMEIRKHKMLTEGIGIRQKIVSQQLVNQRTEKEV
jgi:hypothetical protein